ncbi:hypothetical protein GCM10017788_29510 [Amycolatopsis acidiphila]|nr:hypothetical protein GCM10017788_29510 [Amycolatopsis acidiphila]
MFRPDLVRGVAGLSVPFRGRGPKPPAESYRAVFGPAFYQLYFQEPGVAEKELTADLDDTFRRVLYGLSGDAPEISPMLAGDSGLLGVLRRPESLPAWLGEDDLAAFVGHFAGNDFTGPLNWYRTLERNWELTAPWAGAAITVPALFLAGERDPVVNWGPLDQLEGALRRRVPRLRRYELLSGAGALGAAGTAGGDERAARRVRALDPSGRRFLSRRLVALPAGEALGLLGGLVDLVAVLAPLGLRRVGGLVDALVGLVGVLANGFLGLVEQVHGSLPPLFTSDSAAVPG